MRIRNNKDSYEFPAKRKWRAWGWEQAGKRLRYRGIHPADVTAIYLAGEEDADRRVAISQGFQDKNLLAVSGDRRVVSSVRANGGVCIRASLRDLVVQWGARIGVVVADFCCGLEDEVISTCEAIALSPYTQKDTVVIANLQRGREKDKALYYDWIGQWGTGQLKGKHHRGFAFGWLFAQYLRDAALSHSGQIHAFDQLPADVRGRFTWDVYQHQIPSLNWYQNDKGVYFDSIALTLSSGWTCQNPVNVFADKNLNRFIAAAKAVMSKRAAV